jgi:biotin transport system substrate-specific component
MNTVELNIRTIKHFLNLEITLPKFILKVIGVGIFVFLTAIGAYIRVPLFFTPVPLTMQTLFVVLSGALLKWKYGSISQGLYVILGIAGLPIFAGGASGIGVIFGPTGGYLISFIIASFILGVILERNKYSLLGLIIIFTSVMLFILTFGSLWIMIFMRVNMGQAFILGFAPFLIGGILKSLLAATVYDKLKHRF